MEKLKQYFIEYPEFHQILDTIGIKTLDSFSRSQTRTILPDIYRAKRFFNIDAQIPTAQQLEYWIIESSHKNEATLLSDIDTTAIQDFAANTTTYSKNTSDCQKTIDAKNSFSFNTQEQRQKNDEKSYLKQRGITHGRSFTTYSVALIALVNWAVSLVTFFYICWCILDNQKTPLLWTLVIATACTNILYICLRKKSRCSVCGMTSFSWGPKKINYNQKAHKIFLLGHNIPTALHIVLFRWFRCPACGTSQRIGSKM